MKIEEYARNNRCIVSRGAAKVFVYNWRTRWHQCKKNREYLETRFGDWLNEPLFEHDATAVGTPLVESQATGRKPSEFGSLSKSQKRRRTAGKYYFANLVSRILMQSYFLFAIRLTQRRE